MKNIFYPFTKPVLCKNRNKNMFAVIFKNKILFNQDFKKHFLHLVPPVHLTNLLLPESALCLSFLFYAS